MSGSRGGAARDRARTGGAATINDVARRAGVSTATVSRALAQPDSVRGPTRTRVLEAIRELGYIPNAAARSLRRGRTRTVLIVVPKRANPPFFAEVLRGIDVTLAAAGYSAIMGNLDEDGARERQLAELVFSGHIDGVIVLSGILPRIDDRSILEAAIPIVSACAPIDERGYSVLTDEGEAIVGALRHLIDLGHRRLAHLAGPEGNFNAETRWHALRRFMRACDVPGVTLEKLPGQFTFEGGEEAAARFLTLDPAPTGVVACSDEAAISFMKALRAAGRRVPQDVSVVGFDGIEFADYCEPALTTVCQPRFLIGETAARQLLAFLDGEEPEERHVVLANRLRIAGSSAPPPA
ncbi:LacI family DNA-binding transcriptional regulator [Aureimonas sp. AU4]|uniref:LacI family DNA-binding transcriptional regulator n=1 Tax=Aureimonas sp. AU4 TaxID=1638163 RepID=UPI0009E72FF4|nr:LacI family DNA-binding transcriptional regulator [Aureimonas sp. AU4]